MAKKSALGKGLNSLIADTTSSVIDHKDLNMLPIKNVVPNPNQPRKEFDVDQLNELSDSIKQNGILQPLLVRKTGKKYEIVCGERRFQAAKIAGLEEIPGVIRDVSDEDIFKLALIENLQRSDLTPIEEALGFKKLLHDKDLTQEELGKLLSKSRSAITNTLRLLDLPSEVQEYVASGLLTAGHARSILSVPDEDARIKLAEKVVKERLSVRQTEALAPLFSGMGMEKAPRIPTPSSYKRVARQLRVALNTDVKVKKVRGKNKIEIAFEDEDDLERIVASISRIHMDSDIDE